MRIFYASASSPNAMFQSDLWRNNLYLPLLDLGHDVVEFDYDLYETFRNVDTYDPVQSKFIAENRPKVTEALLRQIKAAHALEPIALFFSYFYDACILPEAIDEIRSMGIVTVNWYCNGSYQLHLVEEISPRYDWCLVPEKFRLKDYVAMGARPLYCQEAANPKIYRPYDLPVEFDVVFVGQAYGDRPAYIRHLLDQGIDVHVWGSGWHNFTPPVGSFDRPRTLQRALRIGKRLLTPQGWTLAGQRLGRALETREAATAASGQTAAMRSVSTTPAAATASASPSPVVLPAEIMGGILSDTEMVQLYSRSKINIGFSTCGDTHKSEARIMQVRLRDFEVPMSGGFYMIEYMEELEEFFRVGDEIVCYTDSEDLADKIKYYLRNDSERERIRRAGHERCLRDHSWQKRLETVFKEIGLN